MTPTKTRALDAALDLLGTEGLRALTHARVDDRAGLPKGSTSNYFRTRAALYAGVAEWIVERELAGVTAAATHPATADELVEALSAGIEYNTGPQRSVTAARLVLFLEANHNETLRATIAAGRTTMEDAVIPALDRLGAEDPRTAATVVMSCCEGLILHRIARHDTTDPRPALALVIRSVLPPGR